MGNYLTDETLPRDGFDELIKVEAKNFVLDQDGRPLRKIRDGVPAHYLEWLFRGDFIQRMHYKDGTFVPPRGSEVCWSALQIF
jgi:hypothetical protein